MSVNVLEYNEFAGEINTLRNTTLPAAKTCYANIAAVQGGACGTSLSLLVGCKQANYPKRLTCDLQVKPWDCRTWANIPSLNTVDGSIKVCDVSASACANQLRCGATCTWTVPAGVTTARFQVWGAGAGSHNMCCWGGGMFGGSGAYASVILPVTPGAVYTTCAGCAYCCFMQSAGPTAGAGSASWVTGPGLCNFCADGGESNMYCMLLRHYDAAGGYCVLMNPSTADDKAARGTVYGWCMCDGGGWCWSNTCSGRNSLPFITSCRTWYGCLTAPTKGCHFVIGAPGMFNSVNMGGGGDGDSQPNGQSNEVCMCLIHPPVVNLTCDCFGHRMNSSATCAASCHGFVHCGCFPFPSRGAYPSSVAGGCDNCGGGWGAAGMVCIQWNKE